MAFQYLADIHTRGNTQRVQNDLDWRTIGQERHIFLGENPRDNTFITMAAGHFITHADFAFLGNINAHQLIHARAKLVPVFTIKDLHINDLTVLTMRNAQGSITNLTGFFTEDSTKKSFLSRQLSFSFRRDLTDQNIARTNLSADADNTVIIKVLKNILTYIRNIASDFFWSQLSITGIAFILFNMNRSKIVLFDQFLGKKYCVLVIVAFPSHESDQHIAPQSQLAQISGGAISNRITFFHFLPFIDDRLLINTSSLVRTLEFKQFMLF